MELKLCKDGIQIYFHLKNRGMTGGEAVDEILYMRKAVSNGYDPEDLLEEFEIDEKYINGLI